MSENQYATIKQELAGDFFTDEAWKILYATDASVYRQKPIAVARPKNEEDILNLLQFAREHHLSIIPRAGGTSLAGQVVGGGIVADISKYMNRILEINQEEHWVKVQPGVVLGELNKTLKPYGLQFGPETSTDTRCCIGGMLGNNSCGLHSIIYGNVRNHILEVEAFLADGSKVRFEPLSDEEYQAKCQGDPQKLETKIYQHLNSLLTNPETQELIRQEYPDPEVTRRNNGYALDVLLESSPFTPGKPTFNLSKLIAGSEGTLVFVTSIKINVIPLPPAHRALMCAHFKTLEESLLANLIALKFNPGAVELMDDKIIECTKNNLEQQRNRFFIQGNPGALLMIEFAREDAQELKDILTQLEAAFRKEGLGYHFPILEGNQISAAWNLRKAGLGLLSNIPGDRKGVPGIEDAAIAPRLLPEYIKELKQILNKYGLDSIYYAHIATGEIHIRPMLNLKDSSDIDTYRALTLEVAHLVKKNKGSFSGEHGDGRLRGEYIPILLGDKIYQILKDVKHVWDPENILNPGKITDCPPMNESMRYDRDQVTKEFDTLFDFSEQRGFMRAIEKCNGTGDCRKPLIIGGTMCPTYMTTRDEDKTTRGRANMLRELLTRTTKKDPFDQKEIYDILDWCVSCKGCKSECPSNVDMARLKAEFLQHYYDVHGASIRSKLVAYLPRLDVLAMAFRPIANFLMEQPLFNKALGFTPNRTFPLLGKQSLKRWNHQHNNHSDKTYPNGRVYLFNDEFTNFNDPDIGIQAIRLLNELGYEVVIPVHKESGRTFFSKGLVRQAKVVANQNIELLKDLINDQTPLIGIEPSTILSFRDEYPDLVDKNLKEAAKKLAPNALLFDEFFVREVRKGKIKADQFTTEHLKIKFHGHCHQKSIATTLASREMLSFPMNYSVDEIPSGCCGMAGAFGYEKEHYELSMQIGEMVLFPAIRETPEDTVIAAPGTSCRHQIHDGTGRTAYHPIEVMFKALKK